MGLIGNAFKLVDNFGVPFGIKRTTDDKPRFSSTPYGYDVVKGNISNHIPVRKLGFSPDVDNVEVDLWEVIGPYVFPSAGIQMQVVSTSANDTAAGPNARTIKITYLDSSYNQQTETITLNGVTPVNTIATNIFRINDFRVVTNGSFGVTAAGNLSIQSVGGATTYARITAGGNIERRLVYTVPLGYNFFITDWMSGGVSVAGSNYIRSILRATCNDNSPPIFTFGVFQFKSIIQAQGGEYDNHFELPIRCPEKTDIKVSTIGDTATANLVAVGEFAGFLEPNA